ncbi:hypothetical protein WLZ34_02425 [Thermogladius sp. KZ2Tp1]|uniref:hypothetical protein n=1 Tax=Thermogladius sp. KZ2Tp1 TaxID=3136289 RepID=UPI003DA88B6A
MYHVSLDVRLGAEGSSRITRRLSELLGEPVRDGPVGLYLRGELVVLVVSRGEQLYIDILGPEEEVNSVLAGLRDCLPLTGVYVRGMRRLGS